MKLKGEMVIELTDTNTDAVEKVQETNMTTEAVNNILGLNPMGIYLKASGEYDNSVLWNGTLLPICPNMIGGILLFPAVLEEKADHIYEQGKNLPVAHCIKPEKGWDIAPSLKPFVEKAAAVVEKPTFGSLELPKVIAGLEPDAIELVVLCTDICVIANAMILKAAFPEVPISVDASCCAGVTPESHENALEAMKMCQVVVR